MQIKCPVCGGHCECDVAPVFGQHMLCPYCESKFSYSAESESAYHVSPQNSPSLSVAQKPETPREEKMAVECPYCGTVYEMSATREGAYEKCEVCNEMFAVKRMKNRPKMTLVGKVKKSVTANRARSRASTLGRSAFKKQRFCSNCGGEISVNAVACPICGARTKSRQFSTYEEVPSHMTWAIVILVLCFPVGLAALIFELMANTQKNEGKVEAARNYSQTAGVLVKAGIVLVIIEIVAFLIYGLSVGAILGQIDRNCQREIERSDRQFNEMMDRIERIQYYDYD